MPVFGKQQKKRTFGPVCRGDVKIVRALLWCFVPCYALRRRRREKSAEQLCDANVPSRRDTAKRRRDDGDMTVDENSCTGHGGSKKVAPNKKEKKTN